MVSRTRVALITIAAVAAVTLPTMVTIRGAAEAAIVPPPALAEPAKGNREVAVLAGGCFWGVEAVYEHVRGVIDVRSGYAGGGTATSYKAVSSGKTDKADLTQKAIAEVTAAMGRRVSESTMTRNQLQPLAIADEIRRELRKTDPHLGKLGASARVRCVRASSRLPRGGARSRIRRFRVSARFSSNS